jgi:predicted dithiol-disulfide oxidoreductase (DUF899 family)
LTEEHKVVAHDEWIEARKELLRKEKEFTASTRRTQPAARRLALGSRRQGVRLRWAERQADAGRALRRGIDLVNTTYNYLDLVPKGRDEDGRGQYWVRRHDEYDD